MSVTVARESRSLTIERFLTLRRPADVELSPDGMRLAFIVVPTAKEREQRLEGRLWFGEVDGEVGPIGEVGATEGLPRFSPDGTRLAFISDNGHPGRMSLHLRGHGELGSIDGSVEDVRWSPDGRSLMVLAADLGSDRAGAMTATRIEEEAANAYDPKVIRPMLYWRRLFLVDVSSGDTHEITPEGVNVFEFDWAGDEVAAVCTEDPSESAWYDAWIGLIDIESRSVDRVYTPQWQLQCPRISSSGRIAWIEGISSDRLMVSGTIHVQGVGPLASELNATHLAFADDDTLWYTGLRSSASMFGRLSVDGSVSELYGGDLSVVHVSPSEDGSRLAAVRETMDETPEIILFENGSVRELTSLNSELAPLLKTADWSRYTWETFDGWEIDGVLGVPRESEGGPLPLVVFVHGGPTATWVPRVKPWPLLLTQEGYAVLLANPRGSAGRGQDFARANVGDLGGGDLQDILWGIDALVHEAIADDARVGITGGSYGGFMTSWAVTQTDRFAAAIPMAVHVNWLSFHLTTNIGRFDRLFMNDDPFDPNGSYPQRSPVYHAHKCKTPTLIFHGENDLCTPLPQAFEFYNALVEAGCQAELVIYPREGHRLIEGHHQVDAWHRMRDWFAEYLTVRGEHRPGGRPSSRR